jgi:hypothetical protein
VRLETQPALLAITANSAWQRPAPLAFLAAKSRKVKDNSDRAQKPSLRRTAWWGWWLVGLELSANRLWA